MTKKKNPYRPDEEAYKRALAAERRLVAVDQAVAALCEFVRPTDEMCYGCTWESIVKPLVTPLVGWGRGYPPKNAKDPQKPLTDWKDALKSGSDLMREADEEERTRTRALTTTEQWMRTSEAWDAVTSTLLYRLWRADPGTGCGIQTSRKKKHWEQ